MRSQRHLHIWLPTLLAALGLPGAALSEVATRESEAARPAGIETPETPPRTDPAEMPARAEGPSLAEATGVALDTVLDAARRDGAQWTRQLQSRWKRISIDARAAWQTLRRDPTNTLDG